MIADGLFNKAYFYFLLGSIVMIGIGAMSAGDDVIILTLIGCLLFAYLGWAGAGMVSACTIRCDKVPSVADSDTGLLSAMGLSVAMVLAAFLVIAVGYGLPVFSEDPSIARLEQRNYGTLMLLIEHGLPLMLGFAIIAYQQRQLSRKMLIFVVLAGLTVSTLLAVRYLFFQALLVMFILAISKMDFRRTLWNSLLALGLALVFFVGVQLLRSGTMLDESMLNRLFRRLFIIHYEIFDKSVNWDGEISYVTYLSPLYKLMGENGFNLGFQLFNVLTVGKESAVQGYAPVSVLGEAMINMQELSGALLLIASIFFFMHLLVKWLASFMAGKSAELFAAIVCMEMFRAYAHSLIGFVHSLVIFFTMILAIQSVSQLIFRKQHRSFGGAAMQKGNSDTC